MSAKLSLYQFLDDYLKALQAAVNADPQAPEYNSPLFGSKLRFSHHEYTKEDDWGIHLSNVTSIPRTLGDETKEFDARLIVTTYVRVGALPDRDDRYAAYERANAMALAIAHLIWADNGLGGRTCNTFVGQMIDDFDSLSAGQQHAVTNLYVTVNQSGAPLPGLWGTL